MSNEPTELTDEQVVEIARRRYGKSPDNEWLSKRSEAAAYEEARAWHDAIVPPGHVVIERARAERLIEWIGAHEDYYHGDNASEGPSS